MSIPPWSMASRRRRLTLLSAGAAARPHAHPTPAGHARAVGEGWRRDADTSVSAALAGRRIIVAESSPIGMRSMVDYLYAHGAIVHDAQCGADLLELVLAGHPDCLVLDTQLPASDIVALIRRLRAFDRHRAQLRIIAICTSQGEQERARHLDAGATAVLSRPLCLQALLERLTQVCD